jgi:hypothetical protein
MIISTLNFPVPLIAQVLPDTIGPYMALMLIGFAIGIGGHLFQRRLLVGIGIALIFLATVAFPIAINISHERPAEVLSIP